MTGFNLAQGETPTPSKQLKQVDYNIIPNDKCERVYGTLGANTMCGIADRNSQGEATCRVRKI